MLLSLHPPPSEDLQQVVPEQLFRICFQAFFLDVPFLLLVERVISDPHVSARCVCRYDKGSVVRLSFHQIP